jgi:3-oxoadipate enol-lactonase
MWDERIAEVRAQGTAALSDGAVERWVTPGFRTERPDVADWLRAMVASIPDDGYAACCEAIRDMNLLERLGAIEAPTLVIAADDDPATPPDDHGRLIAEGIADARLLVLEGARHLANVERPDDFTRAAQDHLA